MPKQKNQKGVTILIAVLILSSVVILALAVADVVGRSNRTSKDIGFSEVAYFAAEQGVEEALYSIERERSIENLDGGSGALDDVSGAAWSRTLSVLDTEEAAGMTCDELADADDGICVEEFSENKETVHVKLTGTDRAFQLELDFEGLSGHISLPSNLRIDGVTGSTASTTILDLDTGEVEVLTQNNDFKTINFSNRRVILKIANKLSGGNTLLEPEITTVSADGRIPLSFLITSTGTYKEQKRVIEVQRKNWQIY
jgi:hypothetical protein